MSNMAYKYCIVPMCTNTTVATPNKIFFHVPRDGKRRTKWCKVIKRDLLSPHSTKFCCEDHFDIETDTSNYMRYKIMGVTLRLHTEVIPHKFDCRKTEKNQTVLPKEEIEQQKTNFERIHTKEQRDRRRECAKKRRENHKIVLTKEQKDGRREYLKKWRENRKKVMTKEQIERKRKYRHEYIKRYRKNCMTFLTKEEIERRRKHKAEYEKIRRQNYKNNNIKGKKRQGFCYTCQKMFLNNTFLLKHIVEHVTLPSIIIGRVDQQKSVLCTIKKESENPQSKFDVTEEFNTDIKLQDCCHIYQIQFLNSKAFREHIVEHVSQPSIVSRINEHTNAFPIIKEESENMEINNSSFSNISQNVVKTEHIEYDTDFKQEWDNFDMNIKSEDKIETDEVSIYIRLKEEK